MDKKTAKARTPGKTMPARTASLVTGDVKPAHSRIASCAIALSVAKFQLAHSL